MGFGSSVLVAGSLLALAVSVWFSSNDFRPRPYNLPPPPPLTGPLAPRPNQPTVEKLLEGKKFYGPESIVVEKDALYTCLLDGRCVKLVDGRVKRSVPMTAYGAQPGACDGTSRTWGFCGRPLGLRRYDSRRFMVADAVLGLLFVDFEKGTTELVVSSQLSVDARRLGFPDDLDFADNDTVIFSDATTRHGYDDLILDFLEHEPSGRILQYKLSTGELSTLVDGLMFANGVQMHPDRQSVLFCETGMARIHRYYLAGPKRGRHELFADNLPGFPDNLRLSADGRSLFVALFGHRDVGGGNFFDWAGRYPLLRKALGEFLQLCSENMAHRMLEACSTPYGLFVELDLDGRVISSYHDPTGQMIQHISQITDDGQGNLYLASYANPFIGRVKKLPPPTSAGSSAGGKKKN